VAVVEWMGGSGSDKVAVDGWQCRSVAVGFWHSVSASVSQQCGNECYSSVAVWQCYSSVAVLWQCGSVAVLQQCGSATAVRQCSGSVAVLQQWECGSVAVAVAGVNGSANGSSVCGTDHWYVNAVGQKPGE
jgi:hypothetical protein